MQCKLTISERMKDLRVERGLTLEQLAEATGLSRAALGKYEADDFKDISPYSIVTLAQFYGVSADYLMGLAEQKNHPNTGLDALHLSDAAIDLLESGKLNTRLLCEMMTHKGFQRFLVDTEIYIDRIADMRVNDMNALLEATRQEIIKRHDPGENDLGLRVLELAQVDEDGYFAHVIHQDLDVILRDLRDAHRADSMTADVDSGAAGAQKQLQEAMSYEGSDTEKEARIFCNQLGIPYDKLTPDELAGLVSVLKKSELLKATKSMRGRPGMIHGKGKRKRK